MLIIFPLWLYRNIGLPALDSINDLLARPDFVEDTLCVRQVSVLVITVKPCFKMFDHPNGVVKGIWFLACELATQPIGNSFSASNRFRQLARQGCIGINLSSRGPIGNRFQQPSQIVGVCRLTDTAKQISMILGRDRVKRR